ncbi:MAG: NAD-dependent epimerase/dehydratase family protein [Chloroflexota bacterium]
MVNDYAGRTCLVTGASGFLGSYLVEQLVDRGARVRCLVRHSSNRQFLPIQDIEFALGDVTDPRSLGAALAGVDVIFHAAGLIKTPHPQDYFQVNYLGTINLLEACRRERGQLRRLIIVSSQAAAGPSSPGQPTIEARPGDPVTPYGKSKLLAEQAALAYRDRLPITIVRPPTIYGPRDRESLLLFQVIARGVRPMLAGPTEISVVHAADLAEGILLAAAHPAAVARTYFLAADEICSLDDLTVGIARALDRSARAIRLPDWAIRGAASLADTARVATGVSMVFDRWKAEELLSRYWACSNALARSELGFSPRIALSDGLLETARWYRTMGWL